MAYTHYDRLTALDTSFLDMETPAVHLHVGSVGIFEPGPLARSRHRSGDAAKQHF